MLGLALKRRLDSQSVPDCHAEQLFVAGAGFAYAQRGCQAGCDTLQHVLIGARLIFLLLDIAGDRTSGSAVAARAAQVFHRSAVQLFAAGELNESEALSALTRQLNRELIEAGGVRCAAAFLGCYDTQTGALWYVNAGHTPALVHDDDPRELGASGVPLGLFSHAIHDAQISVLGLGSAFVLVSKGVTEMRSGRQEFGLAGVRALAAQAGDAAGLCAAVLDAAERFGKAARQDRTAVALVRG